MEINPSCGFQKGKVGGLGKGLTTGNWENLDPNMRELTCILSL